MHLRFSRLSPELPSVIANAFHLGPRSPQADLRFPLTLKNLRFSLVFSSLQWECFYLHFHCSMEAANSFFSDLLGGGRRKGRWTHTRHIHNPVESPWRPVCFVSLFSLEEWAWWSSWPSHMVTVPEAERICFLFCFCGCTTWHVGCLFPDQGWNPCPLHWKCSQPLDYQGSPDAERIWT